MTILAIDPGLETIGYGAVRREGSRLVPVVYGAIVTPRIGLADRLLLVHEEVGRLIGEHRPDALATERLLFSVNKTTAMDVARALGCAMLAGSQRGLSWTEYSPPEIKLAVVGNGSAEKKQVQYMVAKLLGLRAPPRPDDAADALAIAICHAMRTRAGLPV